MPLRIQLYVSAEAEQLMKDNQIPFIVCKDGRYGLVCPSEARVNILMDNGFDVFKKNGEKCLKRPSLKRRTENHKNILL